MSSDEKSRKQSRVHTQIFVWYSFHQQSQIQSQLVDLSESGLCLNSECLIKKDTVLTLQIQFPHLYPQKTMFQGKVVGHNEVVPNVLYQTHVEFIQNEAKVNAAISHYLKIKDPKHLPFTIAQNTQSAQPQVSPPEQDSQAQINRKQTRSTLNLAADYFDEVEFSVGSFQLRDMSAGGAKVLSDIVLPLNKRIALIIKLPQGNQRIPVNVCWSHKDDETGKIMMGLSFDLFYIKEIKAIQDHLQSLKKS